VGGVGRHPVPELLGEEKNQGQGQQENDREAGGDGFQNPAHEDGPIGIESVVEEGPEKRPRADGEADGEGEQIGEGELGVVGGPAPDEGGGEPDHAQNRKEDGEHTEFLQTEFLGGREGAVGGAHGLPAWAKSGGKRLAGAFWENWRARM